MNEINIKPNVPVVVSLVDPEGEWHDDIGVGEGWYQTTTGQFLRLPRPAVVKLNLLEPRAGEEVRITQHWSGRHGEPSRWTVELTSRSEVARAEAGEADPVTERAEGSESTPEGQKAVLAPPVPIRKAPRKTLAPEVQPRLFDRRGTGTDGPAPAAEMAPLSMSLPAVAIGRSQAPGKIPANVAVREILAFVNADTGTANWSDQARQDLASTVYIAAVKAGHVTLWERKG